MASPYNPTAASRFYSSPPGGPHNVLMGYVWDASAVAVGQTGQWRAITPQDLAGAGATGTVGTRVTPNVRVITSSQVIIPAGTIQWSVNVISGTAFVDGQGPLVASTPLRGGGYNGSLGNITTMAVGCTGGHTVVTYETLS